MLRLGYNPRPLVKEMPTVLLMRMRNTDTVGLHPHPQRTPLTMNYTRPVWLSYTKLAIICRITTAVLETPSPASISIAKYFPILSWRWRKSGKCWNFLLKTNCHLPQYLSYLVGCFYSKFVRENWCTFFSWWVCSFKAV